MEIFAKLAFFAWKTDTRSGYKDVNTVLSLDGEIDMEMKSIKNFCTNLKLKKSYVLLRKLRIIVQKDANMTTDAFKINTLGQFTIGTSCSLDTTGRRKLLVEQGLRIFFADTGNVTVFLQIK